jgi:hypothetical protein
MRIRNPARKERVRVALTGDGVCGGVLEHDLQPVHDHSAAVRRVERQEVRPRDQVLCLPPQSPAW